MIPVTETISNRNLQLCSDRTFDYQPRTRVVFGIGSFGRLGELAGEFGNGPVLLVTDPGLRQAGHEAAAVASLESRGLKVAVFDEVAPNPTTDDVDRCVEFAKGQRIQLIVGLGGGSSLDCAKGANFLLTNGGRMHDYKGVGKATHDMLPMIAVPTTSGTGSEAQSFAVIADAETHMKMPCGDPRAACRVAILDPELTVTMPRPVAAATGIDAMTHALESYVTSVRNPVSQMFARQAWALLSKSFSNVMITPDDLESRGDMQLGAHLAGAAIETSMLGAAHATANPLSAHFNTVHGIAVGVMLPHVIRWNIPEVGHLYRDLAISAGWAGRGDTDAEAAEALAAGFSELVATASMPQTLTDVLEAPLNNDILDTLAEEANQQWTGTFNPRTMDRDSFRQLYRNAT
ncbi:MAG: iron-containing alcohol dehydrogenase [Fuerstiella sp.]|jgi:alcohol dehydrogenase|nr:iron-containing alcohol dehydrogenase [Fuerstiella sp.]MCP4508888.1 iron-containing alcohol dehydrogenase [Fuerstiella sp.]